MMLKVVGHSYGLSDRTLLSLIFEHKHCRSIKVHYHNDPNHFVETTVEIFTEYGDKILMKN